MFVQLVTAGEANDEPVPAMPAAVMNGRCATVGGVADERGQVLVVVVDVVELFGVAVPVVASAPTGALIRTSAHKAEIPASGGRVHLRRRRNVEEL